MMPRNKLLARLAPDEWETIRPGLEQMPFPYKMVLHEALEPVSHVYFLESGVASLVNEPENGDIIEVATIGYEGVVGFQLILDTAAIPSRTYMQVGGHGLRLPAASFKSAFANLPGLQSLLLRSTMALFNQISQNTSCNRFHDVDARCARWLLQTHDRVESDAFPLTQEFLAQMLGVHRPTVSLAAAMLQKAGLIQYKRGKITILDRRGLEAAACPCYRTIKDEYDRLLSSPRHDGTGRRS